MTIKKSVNENHKSPTQFAGTVVRIRLKTSTWQAEIERELNLCSSNTGPLYNQFTNSLLGDDFSVPSMEYDMGEGTSH